MKISENKQIKQIKQGNIQTFEAVFRSYYEDLCLFAISYVKDKDLAEEIVQDVFYTIWEKRKELKITSSLRSYLFTSVKNKSLNYIRKEDSKQKYTTYIKNTKNDKVLTPYDEINTKELSQIIDLTIQRLPERTREIFKMNRFHGLAYKEIAEKLSISIKTVEANMGKALKIFRKALTEYQKVS